MEFIDLNFVVNFAVGFLIGVVGVYFFWPRD